MKPWLLASILALGLLLPAPQAAAQQGRQSKASATATLSILAGTVHRIPAGGTQLQAADDGMDLAVGDRIVTWPKATALITFLDGSTVTAQPNSDVAVKKADLGGGKNSAISIQINFGAVWARVVRTPDPKSSFSLESNTATATVHNGLIGGQQTEDGSFVCWTRAGALTVKDPHGQTLVTLQPNEKTTVKAGQKPSPQPFAVNQSALTFTATANVLPLVEMPDKVRVAGFVAPVWEVNQVFGAFTGKTADGAHLVEVPAGIPGPFLLVVHGLHDGPFKVTVVGSFKGAPIYQQELTGTIKKGERLRTEITQQMDPAAESEPKTARVKSGSVVPFSPWQGPLPGTIVLSPLELKTAGGN
jgi:hypothetical protein